jgi:hypothetical protein
MANFLKAVVKITLGGFLSVRKKSVPNIWAFEYPGR